MARQGRRDPRLVGALGAGLGAILLLVAAAGGCSRGSTPPEPAPSGYPSAGGLRPVASAAWQPTSARMPADVPRAPAASCARLTHPDGWVRAEDAQPGDPGFTVPTDDRAPQVVGYADRRSAACGDSVTVYLSGPHSTLDLEAYRVGAYQNAQARLVWRSGQLRVAPRPMPALQPTTHLREADWPATVSVPVSADWPPGFYLLVPRSAGGVAGPAIPLVVRDDADREPVLFAASTLTWNAYNEFGDYSLYHGPGGNAAARFGSRATVASFRRPLMGSGYRQLTFMDVTVVRELEQIAAAGGPDVAYSTDVDLDQRPSQLLSHAEIVFGGHSEYWTRREYDAVAVARNVGVNLAFLGANNLWWHTRLDSGPGSVQPDREIVYRAVAGDPTPSSRSGDLTLLWSQWPEHRDASSMLGQSHAAIGVHGGYQLLGAPSWLLAGTGLTAGTVQAPGSTLPMAVGNEADGYNPLGANPRDLTVVAAGVLGGVRGPVTVSAGYYVARSGAGVFAAGSTDWSCGLWGPCADQQAPDTTSTALRALTRNIVTAFAQARAGLTHPSVPGVVPPPASLLTHLDPAAVGRYGAGSESAEEGAVSRKVHGTLPLAVRGQ